jgi:hypothetical protein
VFGLSYVGALFTANDIGALLLIVYMNRPGLGVTVKLPKLNFIKYT